MSKIEKELVKVTGIETKRNEDRAEFLGRVGKAVGGLKDKDWESLSEEAQDWFNDSADARNAAKKAGKDLPAWAEFPDYEAPKGEEEAPARRRRGADDDGEEKPAAKASKSTGGPDVLKEGLVCEIETTRGKKYAGEVIELTKEDVVLKDAEGEEIEISVAKVATVTYEAPAEAPKGKKAAAKDDAEEKPALVVGATVKVTTKRGKVIEGDVLELSDDEIVLKTDDDEEELRRDRIESIEVLKGAKKAEKKPSKDDDGDEKPAAKGKGKSASKDDAEEKPARARNGGVSVAVRVAELMADDQEATEEEIGKQLKKEGIEFKENTLSLNFTATKKIFDVLKAKKLLKG